MDNKFEIFNMQLSDKGPLAVPIILDFTINDDILVDLSSEYQQGFIDYVSGIWVDNSENSEDLYIKISSINQTIVCAANTQGYYPVFITNPPVIDFETTGDVKLQVIFYNVPLFPISWSIN